MRSAVLGSALIALFAPALAAVPLYGPLYVPLSAQAVPTQAVDQATPHALSPHTLSADTQRAQTTPTPQRKAPSLRVTTRVRGLNHPWDVKQLPSKALLITERAPARLSISRPGGGRQTVRFPSSRIWVSGETGLMGLEVDPRFTSNRRFYTCSGWRRTGGGHDIRVNAWRLNRSGTRATHADTLLTGLPTTSGRHGGCRLLIANSGALLVGTGDAAVGSNPRNTSSLGGKTLRLNRMTGRPWPSNPWPRAKSRTKRYVFTYGHRNVQGLAQRGDGSLWSVEHGSYRDDEVNRLRRGGDYGWNPVPGYDESVPMTDHGLPGTQRSARWRSGSSTVATSGATFIQGRKWGARRGLLAVATLKGQRLLLIRFRSGRSPVVSTPQRLNGDYGRLRTVSRLSNNNLLITTDDDGGRGRVLLVKPR